MERDEIIRSDFPVAAEGYERRSVEAHLEAVAASVAALEARITALTVECEALAEIGDPSGVVGQAGQEQDLQPVAPPRTADPGEAEVAARLVALKLVLDGKPRDEVIAAMEREFVLEDPADLVDEVIARTG